jgi:hypothetical protein
MSRNRIVINLDQSPGARPQSPGAKGLKRKTRRWPKIVALLAGLVIAIVVLAAAGGYFWWRHYQTTPAYSLALILDAALRNDMAAFDKHMNDDEIGRNMVTNFKQRAESRYGGALTVTMQQQIDNLLPLFLPRLKQAAHLELAKQIKEFSTKVGAKPFIVVALTVPSLVKITTEAETAKVAATISDRPFELTMRRDGDRWKVTALNDDTLTQRLVDDMMKELPPIGGIDAKELLKKSKGRRKR